MYVYAIFSKSANMIYIGSTENIKRRFQSHKSTQRQIKKNQDYHCTCTSKHVLVKDDCTFEILEIFPLSTTNRDLKNSEKSYILKYRNQSWNVVNKVIPNRTSLEYYYDNRDELKSRMLDKYHSDEGIKAKVRKQALDRYYFIKEANRLGSIGDVFTS